MRKQIKVFFLFILLIALFQNQSAFGVIAYPYPVEISQPDGTKITIILKGDEHVKWAQTVDGYSIMHNSKGIYEYAILDSKNDMVPSGIQVKNKSERSSSDIFFLSKIFKGLTYSKSQVGIMKSISKMLQKSSRKVFPTTGSRKLVCILIGYQDKAFTKTQEEFNNLFNQVGYNTDGATGSVKDFYAENSYDQFDLTVTVAGPFTAAHNMSYYGANNGSGDDIRPRELVTEAINLADPTVNFADFDNDSDGSVDGVYVIYAGYGEEAGGGANAIWAHNWNLSPSVIKDGKTISEYSCSPELSSNSGTSITAIGVICHEFGHVMGAADFYDTDYGTNGQYSGTGNWDIMAGGSWNNSGITPAHHNPYTKLYVYGWATATTLTSDLNITLTNAEEDSSSFYRVNTATSNEFFLIENRQQHKFDSNIPGHGMIIYHVDGNYISTAGNGINAGSHQGMYPVCANVTGNPPTNYGVINSSWLPFPGTSNKTSFTDTTTPNSLSWAGANTNKYVTNITENTTAKTVSFSFGINIPAPTAITVAASIISPTAATLNAQVNANGSSTTVTFEYGTTTSYGTTVNGTPFTVTGTTLTNITADLTGLTTNTTYNYRVKAVNSGGTTYGSNMTFTPVLLNLPVTEDFTASTLPTGWTTQNTGTGITERWSLSNTANAGGAAYELMCSYQDLSPAYGTTRVITPAINTIGVSNIVLSFKHLFNDYGPGATLRIQSSKDKVTWTNETWSLASSSDIIIGPATVDTTITNNLNSATTYIAFVVDGNLFQFDNWYIDNVSLTNGAGTTLPTVSTTEVSTVSSTTATSGGNVTFDGSAIVTARGVCWSTTANPTIADSKTSDGTGTGVFTSNITGLMAGTTYHVRGYATNSAGTGYGADVSFTTLPDPPPAPSANPATTILQTSFTANWSSSATATGYRLDVATNIGFTTFVTGFNDKNVSNVTTYSVTGLSANTPYYYRVRAYNSGGTSTNSGTITTTTLPNPPSAPSASAATTIVQTSFVANWNSSATATGYRLDVATDNGFTTFVSGYSDKDVSNITTCSVTGLIATTTYYYRIRAYNTGGASSNSNTITVTTLPNPPSAPSASAATTIVQTSFTAKWNTSATSIGYRFDVATNSGFTTFVTGFTDKDVSNVTTYNITGLSAKTTYYYRVRAYNTGGNSPNSNTITVTTLTNPSSVPTGLTASSCNDLVTLKWKKSTGPDFIRYRIYGGTTSNPTTITDSTTNSISDTIKIISGLTRGQTYYFHVTAVNYDGVESSFSDQSTAIVKTGVVPRVKAKWSDLLICYNQGDSIKSFQWYKGSTAITGETKQYYKTDKKSGVYKVETIDLNGCKNSSNIVSVTGTKSLSAYPNPAHGSFVLSLNDESQGMTIISIINSTGIKVLEFQTEKTEKELLKEISVTNLPYGVYQVQVLVNNEDFYFTQIVVVK